jgi:hypothetical protein
MSKRRSPSSPPVGSPAGGPARADHAALRAHVQALLARGKTRDAVEAARQLYKATRALEAEALLVDAYEARIRALMAGGMPREARELAALVVERHPGTRARILPLVHESAARAGGDPGPVLAALASADAAGRRALEDTLRRVLIDPRAVAGHPALSDGDPLREGARVVSELFTAVTTGPLAGGALARLDVIPRQSPLAPWKLLIRAIDAYYRGADAAVLANLAAVPADSAPARLVPVLRCLAGDTSVDAAGRRSLAERALLDRVSGGRARFRLRLADLARALGDNDQRQATEVVRDLAEAASGAPPAFRATFIATILTHWIRLDLDPDPLLSALVRARVDVDAMRQLALSYERAGVWEAAVAAWDSYLTVARRIGAVPLEGRLTSRVLLHMAGLLPSEIDEVLDLVAADDEEDLDRLIRAGVVPECLDRARLLERAREADPRPDVFRALVAHWTPRDARRAESAAEAWRTRHPRDLEPLFYLADAAERRGAHRKALDLLAQAEAIDRVHPDVRRRRFRILLSSAERRLQEGRVDVARRDIDRLAGASAAAEGDRPAYLGALRWAAACREGDTASAETLEAELARRLASPVLLDLLLVSVATHLGLEPPPSRRASAAEAALDAPRLQAIEGLARAADLLFGLERPLTLPAELLARIEVNPRGAPPGQLHSLCTIGLRLDRPSLAYAAAGAGLALESALTHRFLLARGRALAAAPGLAEHARARQCLRAARAAAARLRDTETLREASAALRALPPDALMPDASGDDPTPDEVRRVIAGERARSTMPRFVAGPAPRRRRPGRRRPQPPRFMQEIFSFLEPGS